MSAWAVEPLNLLWICLRTSLVYVALILLLRLAGKRELAQLTPFDLVLILVLSNAVQNAMVGPDDTVAGGIAAALVLIVLNKLVSIFVTRSHRLKTMLEGRPTVLVLHGKVDHENLKRENYTELELLAALRRTGIGKVENCGLAMVEIDGTISALRKDEPFTEDYHAEGPNRR